MRQKLPFRHLAAIAATVLLWAAVAPPPPVYADPQTDIWTRYYTCDMIWQGEKFRGCGSLGENWGILSGHFKEIESCSCEAGCCNISWYRWTGSSWQYIGSSEPAHEC